MSPIRARIAVLLASTLAAQGLSTPAAAQHAEASLFVRAEGTEARAAIVISIEDGWHIYHGQLGPADAVGEPTRIQLDGAGIAWEAPVFPEPYEEPQPGLGAGGGDTFILAHEGEIVVYARGTRDPAAADPSAADVSAAINGQTCDASGCVPWKSKVKSSGRGPDVLWVDFPARPSEPAESSPTGAAESLDLAREQHAHARLFTRAVGAAVAARIEIEIDSGWHLYGNDVGGTDPSTPLGVPTRVGLGGQGIQWGRVEFPPAERHEISALEDWAWIHRGTLVLYAEGAVGPGGDVARVSAEISGQTCEDDLDGLCVPYEERVESSGAGPAESWGAGEGAVAGARDPQAGSTGSSDAGRPRGQDSSDGQKPLSQFLLAAIGWGLFSLLMPCTYPMIPITISFFTKQAAARGGQVSTLALAYGLGIVAMFVLIGVVVGAPIIQFATHPVTNLVIGGLFVVFALSLFGLYNLEPPQALMALAGQASSRGGYVGVFFMGFTLVITSFTCTAPFVGSLLAFGAQGGEISRVVVGMATFGLTMAVPFVALALVPGRLRALPRSGEWMHSLKVWLGFVEIAAALKFFSNADLVWNWGLLPRELFLVLWLGIFLAAAAYLFGWIKLEGDPEAIGPGRMTAGLGTLLFGLYCGYGALGHEMDSIVTPILPNYSDARTSGGGTGPAAGGTAKVAHAIVVDDYDAARAQALVERKLVLVNFTGHT